MSNDRITTTGYRLADGRYFIVKTTGKKVVAIRQTLFGCGIYPAPAKDVPEQEWPEVLAILPKESTRLGSSTVRLIT